jgi:hypothetical protein
MAVTYPSRVHIAPMGYEVDRVVEPLVRMGADKVHLLVHKKPKQLKALKFSKLVLDELRKQKHIKYEVHYVDIFNYIEIMSIMNRLVSAELKQDNLVFINVASGSSITAIAGAYMGSMHPHVEPYYVIPESWGGKEPKKLKPQTEGVKGIQPVLTYSMDPPHPTWLKILKILQDSEGSIKIEGENYFDLTDLILKVFSKGLLIGLYPKIWKREPAEKKKGMIDTSARHYINRHFLEPMEHKGYIRLEPRGRKVLVSITNRGKDTLTMFEATL